MSYIYIQSLLGKSEELDRNKDFYATGDLIEWIDENQKILKFVPKKLINEAVTK